MRTENAARHRFCHVDGIIGRIDSFERFVRTVASGQICVKGRGHWLMEEAPDQVSPKLVEFLNR